MGRRKDILGAGNFEFLMGKEMAAWCVCMTDQHGPLGGLV